MKKIYIAVVIILIVVLGYFLFTKRPAEAPLDVQNTGGENAKINIDAVCEGALAYMTFPDGESADKFVADCKDGKYPEVIERYKADMNLGDGAAI